MRELIKKINHITEDNQSGSISILNELILETENFYKRNSEENVAIVNNILIDQLLRVYNTHSQLITIFHFINELFKFYEAGVQHQEQKPMLQFINEYKSEWECIETQIYGNFKPIFDLSDKKILLHSNSSTVQLLLRQLKQDGATAEIYQTVSHPAKEGLLQANYLADLGFQVNLIEDAAIGMIMDEIQVVLMGTDAIFGDYFVNKIGSKAISVMAKFNSVPVFLIADSRKILHEKVLNERLKNKFENEYLKPSEEIAKINTTNIHIRNLYFEKISNNLVSRFVNEKGIYTYKNINTISNKFTVSELLG